MNVLARRSGPLAQAAVAPDTKVTMTWKADVGGDWIDKVRQTAADGTLGPEA
jgi:hypothetical protein